MAILVTGGAGFIGSNFVLDWFVAHDETVINIDKLTYAGNLANLISLKNNFQHLFVKLDINEKEQISQLLEAHNVRAIVHFAAESHVDRSINEPSKFIHTNIVGTFNLLEAARHYWATLKEPLKSIFRFLHVSTDEVYGSLLSESPAFTEQSRYEPNSPYSASKAAADHLVRSYYRTYGLPVLITNCSNNYGPYQYHEKFVPLCIQNALLKKPIPIYGDGQQIRDWLYVADHCVAIRTILNFGRVGDAYNIGGCNEKTNISVLQIICDLLDEIAPREDMASYATQITYVTDRAGHDRRYAIDVTKISQDFHWKPFETFESGIRKTVNWYLSSLKQHLV